MSVRKKARTVDCPKCRAGIGYPCLGRRGARKSVHAERIQLYVTTKPHAKRFTFEQLRHLRKGKVYFIHDGNYSVKIGFTKNNPLRRLKELQTGNPNELKLLAWFPADAQDEHNLHLLFADKRKYGEWFEFDDELGAFIADIPL